MLTQLVGPPALVTGAVDAAAAIVEQVAAEVFGLRYTSRADLGLLNLAGQRHWRAAEVISDPATCVMSRRCAARGRALDTIFHPGALIAIPHSYVHPRRW